MFFVPSGSQSLMQQRGDALARLVHEDCGLRLTAQVPQSYEAVIKALGAGEADVAWMAPFAYVVANRRFGADARLQVVRNYELSVVVIARSGGAQISTMRDLGGQPIAVPDTIAGELRRRLLARLDNASPGWEMVRTARDIDGVRLLLDHPETVAAAASTSVSSGPQDFVGDGRKELEALRPGALAETVVIDRLGEPVVQAMTSYRGCVMVRADSDIRSLGDLAGHSFAFTDIVSSSGCIFAKALLNRHQVALRREYFLGGHPNVVQAVWAGRVTAGAVYYSPSGERNRRDGSMVGDARGRLLRRLTNDEDRIRLLERLRVIAITDPIPSDVCCVRRDLPDGTWSVLEASLLRVLSTPEGRAVYSELVGGTAATPTTDAAFDGFRSALADAGVAASELLAAEEVKLSSRAGG